MYSSSELYFGHSLRKKQLYLPMNIIYTVAQRADRWPLPAAILSGSTVDVTHCKEKRLLPQPPKHNLMYHPSRYKTEICRQFEELGTCEYGERCLFAHGQFELRDLPNRHPRHKTERCSAYELHGFCSFGPRCSFIHPKSDAETILRSIQKKAARFPMPENPCPERCRSSSSSSSAFDIDATVDDMEKNGVPIAGSNPAQVGHRLPVFRDLCEKQKPKSMSRFAFTD